MKCSTCDGSGLVEETHGMGSFEYLGCQDCQGTGLVPGLPHTIAICRSCNGQLWKEDPGGWEHARFTSCAFPDPVEGSQNTSTTPGVYIHESGTYIRLSDEPAAAHVAIFDDLRLGHTPPNTNTEEPALEAEIVHDAPRQGRCSSCQWWQRDTLFANTAGATGARESIEWGTCLIASDDGPTDPTPTYELIEARKSAPFQASAGGWDVEEVSLNTRSNFGCTEWRSDASTST